MISLFQGVGRCRISPNSTLQDNIFYMEKVSNLLVIDQTVATGFSCFKSGMIVMDEISTKSIVNL